MKTFSSSFVSELEALRQKAQIKTYGPGEVVFREGDPGDGVYFVNEGVVRITALLGESQRRLLATLKPGDFFGEMAVLDGEPRSAEAMAEQTTRLEFIPREEILAMLERSPQMSLTFLKEFSRRMRDMDRRYVEEAIESERLAILGRFARGIVHDFRNPLHIVSVSLEMAAQERVSADSRDSSRKRARKQIGRMNRMIDELLEFTRTGPAAMDLLQTDYAEFVAGMLHDLRAEAAARSCSLSLSNSPPAVSLLIDSARLSHVFYNLVNNACDSMPGGGRIRIRFRQNESEVITEVEDTGRGIPASVLPHIFEPFAVFGKSKGTGLGLSICKKIIEDHQGVIAARSDPNRGAVFAFSLPSRGTTSAPFVADAFFSQTLPEEESEQQEPLPEDKPD